MQNTRLQIKPDDMDRLMEQTADYVETQPAESWTDSFYMMGGSYNLTSSAHACCPPAFVEP